MKNNRNILIGISAGLVVLILFNITAFAYRCNEIRCDVIRLHIIAESDSKEDQALKLLVRDNILKEGKSVFDGTVSIENAVSKITPQLGNLKKIADNTIKEQGFSYSSKVILTEEYFDTRTYNDSVTLPAGKYLALKIILGSGQGKNWWCVMFPSLCLPAVEKTDEEALSEVFSTDEKNIVLNSNKYSVKFKIVELIESFKHRNDN